MRKFDKGDRWDDKVLNLVGQYPNLGIIPPGVSLIHFILWKFVLIALTQVAIKGEIFNVQTVIDYARKRVKRRVESARTGLQIIVVQAEARGKEPKYHQYTKWLRGIGTIVDGEIVLEDSSYNWLYT